MENITTSVIVINAESDNTKESNTTTSATVINVDSIYTSESPMVSNTENGVASKVHFSSTTGQW